MITKSHQLFFGSRFAVNDDRMVRIGSEHNTTLIYFLAGGLYIVIRCLGELPSTDTLTRFRFLRSAKVHARNFLRRISVTFNERGNGLDVYVAVRNLIFYKKVV